MLRQKRFQFLWLVVVFWFLVKKRTPNWKINNTNIWMDFSFRLNLVFILKEKTHNNKNSE